MQAVLGTFAAAGVTLGAYKFFNIQVTPRFRQIVIISTFGFAIAMLIVVCAWGVPKARHRWSLIACGMLIAGICGNLTDRIFREPGPLRGHVVDFISLPHFAVFNVADIFITGTAILVVLVSIFGRHDGEGHATDDNVRGERDEKEEM